MTSYDAYKILQVSSTASDDEIKIAYRNLMKKFHPDNFLHLNDSSKARFAEEKSKLINNAYETVLEIRKACGAATASSETSSYSSASEPHTSHSEASYSETSSSKANESSKASSHSGTSESHTSYAGPSYADTSSSKPHASADSFSGSYTSSYTESGTTAGGVSTGRKVGKAFMNVFLAPFWFLFWALRYAFIGLAVVSGLGIVRGALGIWSGFVILGSILMGSWDPILWLGLPAGFLLILPNISESLSEGCANVARAILDFWRKPAGM